MRRPLLTMRTLYYPNNSKGFALIAVLVASALLSLIAASLISLSTEQRRASHLAFEHTRAKLLAEAAVADAVLRLLDSRPDHNPRTDGSPYNITYANTRMTVSIQDEAGKIDINAVEVPILVRVFQSTGLDLTAAQKLADRVNDWRRPRFGKSLNGTDAADYVTAGRNYLPRNDRFQRVDELKLVLGVSADMFRRLAPALTVYTHHSSVNLLTAPREVLQIVLPDKKSADDLLAARALMRPGLKSTSAIAPSLAAILSSKAGWTMTVRVVVPMLRAAPYIFETVLVLTDDLQNPYLVEDWREVTQG